MKHFFLILVIITVFQVLSTAQEHRRYALVWNDEFNSGTLDKSVWSKTWRSHSDWAIHMTSNDALYSFEDGDLVLWGKVNDFLPKDTASVLTGGVWTRHRKAFGFGRVEVRAKFDVASGFWPAIWMLPQSNQAINWPYGGEIDIMEHFMEHPYVDQTVHSNYTHLLRKKNHPPYVNYAEYREGEYNTYGVERFQDSLVFFVNGQRTFCYPRYRKGVDGQFPFSNYDYYLILDAQLGGSPSPNIDKTKLPVALRIDYVRYYELDTKTDVIPEPKDFQQIGTKKKKLRKVVYDTKTHFTNPDEYHLKIKCGKATISGNRHWAESTLAQLMDENGRIANLEVHDRAACPYRGVALKENNKLSINDLKVLFDLMAFYKLNRFLWLGVENFSNEEQVEINEYATERGITIVKNKPENGIDVIVYSNDQSIPMVNRIFLQDASEKGGVLYIGKLDIEIVEAIGAFSERYWRGGNAGNGSENLLLDLLTPAGSRLANFKEKLAVHRERFKLDLTQ